MDENNENLNTFEDNVGILNLTLEDLNLVLKNLTTSTQNLRQKIANDFENELSTITKKVLTQSLELGQKFDEKISRDFKQSAENAKNSLNRVVENNVKKLNDATVQYEYQAGQFNKRMIAFMFLTLGLAFIISLATFLIFNGAIVNSRLELNDLEIQKQHLQDGINKLLAENKGAWVFYCTRANGELLPCARFKIGTTYGTDRKRPLYEIVP